MNNTVLLLAALLVACGSDPAPVDGGADASSGDASREDAGIDAAVEPLDAGEDASSEDASSEDASSEDASSEDASSDDASTGADATTAEDAGGLADAGVDAGSSPRDAGVEPLCTATRVLRAHAAGTASDYALPAVGGVHRACFTFPAPSSGEWISGWVPEVSGDARILGVAVYATTAASGDAIPCFQPPGTLLARWAEGEPGMLLPATVGIPMTAFGATLVMQVRYENATGAAGLIDRSGIALCTTTTAPDEDAGWLAVGPNPASIAIPVGATAHVITGTCPSTMTGLLPGPVRIHASAPSMYLFGRALQTERLAGGSASMRSVIDAVPGYDFDRAPLIPHVPGITVTPGDAVEVRCTYDNPGSAVVVGGDEPGNESCHDLLLVAPRVAGAARCP